MRLFRKLETRRPLGLLCTLLMLMPIGTFATKPAAAQMMGTLEVAVVEFRNVSKTPDTLFGTMATDALVVELLRSGKFSVTAADALQKAYEDLGYKTKEDRILKVALTPSMMVRLGQDVVANCVVTGELVSIKVDKEKKKAEVRMAVRMLDVASGEWLNGAIATGASHPRIGYTADRDTDWIIEAINNAARKAVETMVQYIIPEATVIGTVGTSEVLLNKGSQEGLAEGMEMIVLRRGDTGMEEVVGRVRVSKTTDTDSIASVTQFTRGVRPEDRVRAVFELPADTGRAEPAVPRAQTKKSIAKGSKMLWGLAALIGLAMIFKGGGGGSGETLPAAIAQAGMNEDLPIDPGHGDVGILVSWDTPHGVRIADIIEYHIWRDNLGQYGYGGSGNIGIPVANPEQPSSGTFAGMDHAFVDNIVDRTIEGYQFANSDHELDSADAEAVGITLGKPHRYWVSMLYRRINPTDPTLITYWETNPIDAGQATALTQPVPKAPGSAMGTEYQDLSICTFEWEGSLAADLYRIECSADPDFKRTTTWCVDIYQPTGLDHQPLSKTFLNVLNLAPELSAVQPGDRIYWRVGARRKADRPGPYPAGMQYSPLSAASDGAKNTRFIYSAVVDMLSFLVPEGAPGPPPGDGSGGDGGINPPGTPF